jgi:hypothetical protein
VTELAVGFVMVMLRLNEELPEADGVPSTVRDVGAIDSIVVVDDDWVAPSDTLQFSYVCAWLGVNVYVFDVDALML